MFLIVTVCAVLAGCGLNQPDKPMVIRALTPDKFGISWKFNQDDDHSGTSYGFSWNLE